MATVYKPPFSLNEIDFSCSVFLAGSIEMDTADDWQIQAENSLNYLVKSILNPRRNNWDPSWEQIISNKNFREQVEWELTCIEKCSSIAVYFDPNTKSPITLMELGLFANSGKISVCCPMGFWRKGNVDVVCMRYNIPQFSTLEQMLRHAAKIAKESEK